MASTAKSAKPAKPPKAAPLQKQPLTFSGFRAMAYHWLTKNYCYVIAFCVPALLMYIAYAIFGIFPFGPESVLVLDLNGQYVYYFEAIRDAFWGDGSIFYNWSRNLSGEYMGIIGYYLASPFTLIVMLLPRTMLLGSLLIMQLTKLGAAGVTFCYFLQKSKNVRPMNAMIFSLLYAMMAYGVIQLIDPMWLDGMVFLPLICLGVEYLIDDGRKLNLIIPLAMMCIANFYIAYMICIFTAVYFLYYLAFGSEKFKRNLTNIVTTCLWAGLTVAVALMCAAILLLPVYNALKLGKFDFTANPDYSFKLQFEPLAFLSQLIVAQYDSVNVQGSPEVFCGILSFLLLPIFYCCKKISARKKIGFSMLLAFLFASMYINPLDMAWHGFQEPNWLPYRYSFIFSFVLLTMAAMTFEHIKEIKPAAIYGSFFGIFMYLMFILYDKRNNDGFPHLSAIGAVWVSAVLLAVYALLLFGIFKCDKLKWKRILPILVMVVCAGEMTYNAYDSLKAIDKEVAYSERISYNKYIADGRQITKQVKEYDPSVYRMDKTYHRTVNDPLAFDMAGISHSSSVMNTRIIKFIETMGYTCRSYYTKYMGDTPISDSMLGIKYVMDMDDDVSPYYQERFSAMCHTQTESEKRVTVYENTDALALGYMVDQSAERITALGNDNPFNSQNVFLSTCAGKTTFDEAGQLDYISPYFHRIDVDEDYTISNLTPRPYGNQTCYDVTPGTENLDHTIDIKLKAETDEPIYIFFKTENERQVNLWLKKAWEPAEGEDPPLDEEGNPIDFEWFNSYYEGDNYRIMCLGSFEPGQELTLRATVTKDYVIVQNFFFYHFDYDLFQQDISVLKENQWDITEFDEDYIEGTITAKDNQIMMTSIPYEEGWTIKVDGKKVEPTVMFNALIGIPMSPGEHTVTMRFLPAGFLTGVFLLIIGIGCCVMFYLYDRKHNKVLIALIKAKREERASLFAPKK